MVATGGSVVRIYKDYRSVIKKLFVKVIWDLSLSSVSTHVVVFCGLSVARCLSR